MSNGPQDFLTKIPEFPLLEKAGKMIADGIDGMINGIIEKCGSFMDTCTAEVKGMGKAGLSLGSGKLAGGLDSAPPLAPGGSPSTPSQGESQQVARSMVPERVQEQVKSMPSSQAKGFEVASMSGHDYGNLTPSAASAGVGQSQGRAV